MRNATFHVFDDLHRILIDSFLTIRFNIHEDQLLNS